MQRNITKLTTLILFIAISFSACKKDSNKTSGSSNMTFTDNGKQISLNTCLVADISVNDIDQTNITANNRDNSGLSFVIHILKGVSELKAGDTFPLSTDPISLEPNTMRLIYWVDNSDNVFQTQANNGVGTVRLTQVTSSVIKGTFSGQLFDQYDENAVELKHTITAGTFTAKR